jgi:hypothetical protein
MAAEGIVQSVARIFEQVLTFPAAESFARSGSYLLRLCFVRQSLAEEFLPSFLQAEAGLADLQIGFLTSAEADLSHFIPFPPSRPSAFVGEDWFVAWQPGDLPVLYLLDRRSMRALIWLPAGAAPYWIVSRPTLPVMYAFSTGTPWVPLHAAAVGRNGRILLLVGEGRIGKSTAALACARAGWDYVGDDYVYANTANSKVEPLYRSARLRADMGPALSDFLTSAARMTGSDNEVRYELRIDPECVRGGSLAAILLPRRCGGILPKFSPARRIDVAAALYTSMTLMQWGWSEITIKKLTTLIGLAPVTFVDTGQCPAAIPDAFAEFLDRL